ncbi:MAG: ribonuclease J [Candidatus Kaiserbacteria bacterium]|nr:ribonuclease J [Candidatus Kaiserbacteria bacterium]
MAETKKPTTTKKVIERTSAGKKASSKKSASKKTSGSGDVKKQKVSSGLYQKPLRRQGGLIGSRELTTNYDAESTLNIPRQEKDAVRILFFGGVGEIGKNMYGIEYEDEILLLDCGMKFAQNDTPGIDFIVPNIQYLEERKEKIKGLVISHAHLDHIGGISVVLNRIGNPPIFSRKLSIELIRNRQSEFESKEPIVYHEVEKSTVLTLSENLILTFFSVTHTIPDAMGIVIDTPLGAIVFTGDLKLTHEDGVVGPEEVKEFAAIKKKNILLTMADSTNAERPGFSLPEKRVVETIGKIIKETKGRVILSAFSTQIERTIRIIEHAIESGRKVIVQGRSMITNLTIASELGLLKVPLTAIIPVEKMGDYPKEKLLVLATGAQGDNFTAMDRMSRGTHRHLKLDNRDTVVFSSSIIPGNEEPVQNLKDRLSKLGVDLITYQTSDVHSSGHANRDELKWIHENIDATFFTPIHGYHFMLSAHAQILRDIGMPEENIILPNNGSIVDISPDSKSITMQDYTMPTEVVVVDGNAVGTAQDVVLNDRITLKEEGIFVVIVLINKRLKKVKKSPDIISRGFVYLKESQPLINRSRMIARRSVERSLRRNKMINLDAIKRNLVRETQNYLYSEMKKRPIIVPVIFAS